MTELESGFRIADVVDLLRRRFPIVAVAALLGLVAGYFVFAGAPPTYSATARVQVQPLPADPLRPSNSTAAAVDLATERDLVKSDAVGDAVREQLDLDVDTKGLFANLTVTSSEEASSVLGLTYVSPSPTKARDIVNGIAEAYLADRQADAVKRVETTVARIDQQLVDARAAQSEAQAAYDATEAGTPERTQTNTELVQARTAVSDLEADRSTVVGIDTESVGKLVRRAPLPTAALSKLALGKGVGVFGLFVLAGLGIALLVDRRDSLGGGRRTVAQLAPSANLRVLPNAGGRKAGPAEIDAAIDRLAVELAGQGGRGRSTSVLLVGTSIEPPVALAEELAASLAFAGIPTLFVLAGSSTREVAQAVRVTSFTDLITGPSITGPAALPDRAGAPASTTTQAVVWLQPRGSTESSGLLRRAVVEALVTRAGREGFEAVVFVAGTPTRNAAAAALGPWVAKTAVIVDKSEGAAVVDAVKALQEAGGTITEVVWT